MSKPRLPANATLEQARQVRAQLVKYHEHTPATVPHPYRRLDRIIRELERKQAPPRPVKLSREDRLELLVDAY